MTLPWFLDPRTILTIPVVYNAFQALVGATATRGRLVRQHVPFIPGGRLLEVGCGPGTIVRYIPKGMDYVGCDLSARYIRYASRKHARHGTFIHAAVADLPGLQLRDFDYVLAGALLHHLDDEEVRNLCREVRRVMRPGGRFLAIEACYFPDQNWYDRFWLAFDRGQHIRYPDQYAVLLRSSFHAVDVRRLRGNFVNPGGTCLITAQAEPAAP